MRAGSFLLLAIAIAAVAAMQSADENMLNEFDDELTEFVDQVADLQVGENSNESGDESEASEIANQAFGEEFHHSEVFSFFFWSHRNTRFFQEEDEHHESSQIADEAFDAEFHHSEVLYHLFISLSLRILLL